MAPSSVGGEAFSTARLPGIPRSLRDPTQRSRQNGVHSGASLFVPIQLSLPPQQHDLKLAVGRLVVPTICLLEVFKRMLREKGEDAALDVVGQMRQGLVVDLDADLALEAARLGIEFKLPLANSAILATARLHEATVWTQDEDFDGLDGVRYVAKRNRERREKG